MTPAPRHRSPVRRALAIAATFAVLLGAAAGQTQFRPPATSERLGDAVRASLMPSVARVQASLAGSQAGASRTEQASGFVIDQYKRLVLTSCRILFAEWRTLAIEVEFAATPTVKRTAEPLLCDRALDLAIVRVREFDLEFPRAVQPSPAHRMRLGEGLYILGFLSRAATSIPVIVDTSDTAVPGLADSFIRTRARLPSGAAGAPNVEDAPQELVELAGGPLVSSEGHLVAVNAFSSGERIKHPLSGVELATVPKGNYLARTVESIAPFVRQGLAKP